MDLQSLLSVALLVSVAFVGSEAQQCPVTLVTACPVCATVPTTAPTPGTPATPSSSPSPSSSTPSSAANAPAATPPASTSSAPTPGAPGAAASVSGSGSTALQAFLENALGRAQAASTVKVSLPYSGVGSGQGQQDYLNRVTNYGVSDIPFTSTQYAALGSRQVVQIPAALNTVSVFVNITGVSKLSLDANTIARIFTGQITSFADPAILALNPGLVAPTGNNISIITRQDNSGTTALFSSYLVRAAQGVWTLGSGLSVNFPSTVRSVTGTNSVVAGLQAVGNSIGYATSGAGLAVGLTEVAVSTAAGNFLTSLQGNYDNVANSLVYPAPTGDWSTVNATYLPGNTSYPIVGFSYYLTDANQTANANGALLKQLQAYLQTPQVQSDTAISGLRPLPATVSAAALRGVAAISAPATPDFGLAFSKPANAPLVTGGTAG